jgi:parvulin-like peptidyl-prolyl isomerase
MNKIFSVLLMVAFFMTGTGSIFAAPKGDRILAIVNGEPIFESEFNKKFNQIKYLMFASREVPEQEINELKNQFLEGQIEEILLNNEVKKQKILVSRKEVLEYIKWLKKNYANESEFNAELSKQNITLEVLEKNACEFLKVMKLIDMVLNTKELANAKEPSEAEIKSFYDKVIIKMKGGDTGLPSDGDWLVANIAAGLKKMFSERVRIKQIFIKNLKNASAAEVKVAQAKVETVKKELQTKSFAEIARKYSEDPISKSRNGDFGIVTKGDLPLVLEKAAFSLKIGDYTKEPIKTDRGYYFIKVEEKLQSREVVFDDSVKDYINGKLSQFNKEKAYAQACAHYVNALKAKANIKKNKVWGNKNND